MKMLKGFGGQLEIIGRKATKKYTSRYTFEELEEESFRYRVTLVKIVYFTAPFHLHLTPG